MNNLDTLINVAVAHGELATGVRRELVARRHGARAAIVLKPPQTAKQPHAPWTEDENNFLRRHHGRLSEREIGARLGRSRNAVRIHWKRELRLPAPSKAPGVLTAEQVANGLGLDSKSVHKLIDRGLLPGWRLPSDAGDVTRVVNRVTLLRWIVNPLHWCYFQPERVGAKARGGKRQYGRNYDEAFWAKAQRLVQLRRERWDDEWWRPGDAARHFGVDVRAVCANIQRRKLPATRWGNWWVLKSDALRLARFRKWVGKGGKGQDRKEVSPRADAFIVLAAAVGLVPAFIARMMGAKWNEKRVAHRLRSLHRWKRIPALIREHGLDVEYDPRTGVLFADWRKHANRFKRLARAMERFNGGKAVGAARPAVARIPHSLRSGGQVANDRVNDLRLARGVLYVWGMRQARTARQRCLVTNAGKRCGQLTAAALRNHMDKLGAAGLRLWK